jgi:hypothetical protein
MQKLIEAFKAKPTVANRVKLGCYIAKHKMALCLLSIEDIAFLRLHFKI